MTWVVVSDPVPGGATILGGGLGRDSQIATRGEQRAGSAWPAFEERSFEAFRSYYEYLPRGKHAIEYTVRLNNPGRFALPPTHVEAMYAPESFGETPNARDRGRAVMRSQPSPIERGSRRTLARGQPRRARARDCSSRAAQRCRPSPK